jgi:hypothetical protein
MSIIRTLSMCAVLIAGFALLAVPVPTTVQAQDNHSAAAFTTKLSGTSYNPPACTTMGRPCNPKAPTCCPGLSCVFQGGSTRVGYACKLRRGATGASWELTDNNLNRRDLTELLQ